MSDRVILVINKMDWVLAEKIVKEVKIRFPMIDFSLTNSLGTICISALNIPEKEIMIFLGIQIFCEGILTGMNVLVDYREHLKHQNN